MRTGKMTSRRYHSPFLVADRKDQFGYHSDAQKIDPPSKIFSTRHSLEAD